MLAWLFLFSQQGGVLHELGHAFEDIRYSQQDKHPTNGHSDVCDQCLAYASGGTALPSATIGLAAGDGLFALNQAIAPAFIHLRARAPYRSRAPPLVPQTRTV